MYVKYNIQYIYIYIYIEREREREREREYIYRTFQEESALLRKNFPQVKLHRYNQAYPYPKLKATEIKNSRKIWSSSCPTYCSCITCCVVRTLLMFILEPIAKLSVTQASVLLQLLGNLRTIFMKILRAFFY